MNDVGERNRMIIFPLFPLSENRTSMFRGSIPQGRQNNRVGGGNCLYALLVGFPEAIIIAKPNKSPRTEMNHRFWGRQKKSPSSPVWLVEFTAT